MISLILLMEEILGCIKPCKWDKLPTGAGFLASTVSLGFFGQPKAAKQKKDLEEKRRQEQRSTLAIRRRLRNFCED